MSKDKDQDAGRPALHTLQPLTIPPTAPAPASGPPPTILNVSSPNVSNSPIAQAQTQAQPETLGSGCDLGSDIGSDSDSDLTPAQAIAEAEEQDKAEKERRGVTGISLRRLEKVNQRLVSLIEDRIESCDKVTDLVRSLAMLQAIHQSEPPRKRGIKLPTGKSDTIQSSLALRLKGMTNGDKTKPSRAIA